MLVSGVSSAFTRLPGSTIRRLKRQGPGGGAHGVGLTVQGDDVILVIRVLPDGITGWMNRHMR